jgi:hypothetical protein
MLLCPCYLQNETGEFNVRIWTLSCRFSLECFIGLEGFLNKKDGWLWWPHGTKLSFELGHHFSCLINMVTKIDYGTNKGKPLRWQNKASTQGHIQLWVGEAGRAPSLDVGVNNCRELELVADDRGWMSRKIDFWDTHDKWALNKRRKI